MKGASELFLEVLVEHDDLLPLEGGAEVELELSLFRKIHRPVFGAGTFRLEKPHGLVGLGNQLGAEEAPVLFECFVEVVPVEVRLLLKQLHGREVVVLSQVPLDEGQKLLVELLLPDEF